MQKPILMILLTGLAACTAPSTGGGSGGGGGSTSTIPAVLSQNLEAATYDPGNQKLTIQLSSLDAAPLTANYTRNTTLDIPGSGYEAYEVQFSGQQRHFVALFAQNPRANLMAGVVADGGQFVNYFGGGIYSRVDVFTRPSSGLAVYDGTYVGVLNTGPFTGPLNPSTPFRTTGTARITADFNPGGSVTGGITGRSNVDTGTALADVFLDAATIDTNGEFTGGVKFSDLTSIGSYGGLFGGLGATDIAGILVFHPVAGNSNLTEHGVFVLPCTPSGTSFACP